MRLPDRASASFKVAVAALAQSGRDARERFAALFFLPRVPPPPHPGRRRSPPVVFPPSLGDDVASVTRVCSRYFPSQAGRGHRERPSRRVPSIVPCDQQSRQQYKNSLSRLNRRHRYDTGYARYRSTHIDAPPRSCLSMVFRSRPRGSATRTAGRAARRRACAAGGTAEPGLGAVRRGGIYEAARVSQYGECAVRACRIAVCLVGAVSRCVFVPILPLAVICCWKWLGLAARREDRRVSFGATISVCGADATAATTYVLPDDAVERRFTSEEHARERHARVRALAAR